MLLIKSHHASVKRGFLASCFPIHVILLNALLLQWVPMSLKVIPWQPSFYCFHPVYCVMPQRVPVAHVVSGNKNLISFETNSMSAMQWSQPARSQVGNGAAFEPSVHTTCRYDHNFPFLFPWQQSRQIFIRP